MLNLDIQKTSVQYSVSRPTRLPDYLVTLNLTSHTVKSNFNHLVDRLDEDEDGPNILLLRQVMIDTLLSALSNWSVVDLHPPNSGSFTHHSDCSD